MKAQELKIEGMSCDHCVMAVRKELSRLDNVKVKDVKIGSANVEYDESTIDESVLEKAVEEAGYKVVK